MESKRKLKATFERFDRDKSGELCVRELGEAFADLGHPQETHELSAVLHKVDKDGSQTVNFEEFCTLFEEAALVHVFAQIDTDGSGTITVAELRKALASLDVHLTMDQAQQLVKSVDTSNDGSVSFDEFREFFAHVPMANLRTISQKWMQLSGMDFGSELSAPIPPAHMPLWRFVLAGGLGGVCSRTVTAPLERVRIEAQVHGTKDGVLKSMNRILAKDGARALFAGNGANCLRVFPHAGMACLSYATLVKWLPSDSELDRYEFVWRATAGAGAGITATLTTYPLDLLRTRMALRTAEQTHYKSIMSGLRYIHSVEGWKGLYRGVTPTLYAVAPFVAIQQATYDVLKQSVMEYTDIHPSVPFFLCCGATAGLVAQSVVYPLDLIRRRMQSDSNSTKPTTGARASVVSHYTWLALRSVVRSEGMSGLFRGMWPTFMKVAPAVATSVTVRDAVLGRLD